MSRQGREKHFFGDERVVDLVILVVIALLSLGVAWVCFEVLDSSAEGEFQAYTVGGALAGFVVTASLLWSIYSSLRRSSDELEQLRTENRELEHKVIRGAPRPVGYVVEVDEKERIVLARPSDWSRREGKLYEFVKSEAEGASRDECPRDPFPARLTVSFEHVDPESEGGPEQCYARLQHWMENLEERGLVISPIFERMFVGEAPQGVLSLKVAYSQWVVASWEKDPRTMRWRHIYRPVPRTWAKQMSREQAPVRAATAAGAEGAVATQPAASAGSSNGDDAAAAETSADNLVLTYRIDVICYHEGLKRMFRFEFVDDKTDFAAASIGFNQLLNSTRFLV